MRNSIALVLAAALLTTAAARPAPLPLVQSAPPGAVQPISPGYRPLPPLPTLALTPPISEVPRVEVFGNGFIEVADALALVPRARASSAHALALAQLAVARAFAARSSLAEVDVSVYVAETYAGYGGPAPLLTASVPVERRAEFAALQAGKVGTYDRAWQNPDLSPASPRRAPTGETAPEVPETAPTFEGSERQTLLQRLEQALSALRGPKRETGVLFSGDPRRRVAALTFDDAVHPLFEPLLLDTLRRAGAKATFFVVGRNAAAYPYFVRDLVAQGHELANHTYHHVRLPGLSEAAVREELQRTDDVLRAITGQDARFFRPPGGRYSPRVLEVAKSLGLTTAFWTDDPADFNNPGAATIETRLGSHLRPGGIILLHDNARETLGLLTDFVNDARARGYALTTLRDMLGSPR